MVLSSPPNALQMYGLDVLILSFTNGFRQYKLRSMSQNFIATFYFFRYNKSVL